MIENAMIFVTRPQVLAERIGRMTVFERQLRTAARAGIKRVWVSRRSADDKFLTAARVPEGLELISSARESEALSQCQPPYVVLSGNHFVRVETLRWALQREHREHVHFQDAAGASVIQVVPYRDDRFPEPTRVALPHGASCHVELPGDRPAALSWLMSTALKATDGFMAKHFDRHISLAVSRLLLETPVSPNMMTLFSCSLGAAGALLFLNPVGASALAGALLVWLHSVIDGCDGELARMRLQESRFGAALDFWGDNFVHVLLFSCLAAGHARLDQSALPYLPGLAAVLGSLGSAALAFRAKSRPAKPAEPGLASTMEWLAQRDFIYLLVVLAYFGRTYEFLWAAGAGSVLFFLTMLYLGRGQHEEASQPHPAR